MTEERGRLADLASEKLLEEPSSIVDDLDPKPKGALSKYKALKELKKKREEEKSKLDEKIKSFRAILDIGDDDTSPFEEKLKAAGKFSLEGLKMLQAESDRLSDLVKTKLVVGTKVEARYGGSRNHYPGVITKVQDNGTFDITYDDGDKKAGVIPKDVRVFDLHREIRSLRATLHIGDDEASPFEEKLKAAGKSSMEGLKMLGAESDRLSEILSARKLEVDMKVEARAGLEPEYLPGIITNIQSEGTVDISYENGQKESGVKPEYVRIVGEEKKKKVEEEEEEKGEDA